MLSSVVLDDGGDKCEKEEDDELGARFGAPANACSDTLGVGRGDLSTAGICPSCQSVLYVGQSHG